MMTVTLLEGLLKCSANVFVRAVILVVLWTLFAAFGFTRHYLSQLETPAPVAFWSGLLGWVVCYVPWMALSPLAATLGRRFPLSRTRWPRHLPVLALASVVFSYAAFLAALVLHRLPLFNLTGTASEALTFRIPAGEFWIEESFFWAILGAAAILRTLSELEERRRAAERFELEKAQLETTLRQAELEVLRMRLNPHFLFNSLQNISVLAQQNPRLASRMLVRLGDLLRTALRGEFQAEITLEEEITLTRAYLDIEKMRFRDRLEVEIDIAAETEQAFVPSLLLQPLVENAILHGLAGVARQGKIGIASVIENGRLMLTVRDNGIGFVGDPQSAAPRGIGLGSVYERLARMYPGRHEIAVSSGDAFASGTEIRITLPCRLKTTLLPTTDELAPSFAHSR